MKKGKLFLFLAALCAAAAVIYMYKDRLKKLPFFNLFLDDEEEEEPEEDILREYEETMLKSAPEDSYTLPADKDEAHIDDIKDKEEKSSKNKIRRGYTEIHFHNEEEPEAEQV